MSLMKSSAIVGSLTMLSRIFGFVRDMLIAFILGATLQTDAFFVAFKLPNFFRRLFAEGAFNSAFLPMFAGSLKTDGEEVALKFAAQASSALALILVVVCAVAIIFMPSFIGVIAPGFVDNLELFELTVNLARITFPYIFFISLVSLLGGILNSTGRFAAVAATPILMNIVFILSLVGLRFYAETPSHALAYGALMAGVAQWLWLVFWCRKHHVLPRFVMPSYTPKIRKLLKIIAPAALGAGVVQINLLIDMILASKIDNAVSYLYYADRLYELPLGVIGIAVATALLPMLSKQIRAGEFEAAARITNQSIMLVMLFGLPSAAALIMIAEPIIRVIFEHGSFDVVDRMSVAPALVAYAAGIPAFLLSKILIANFYAAQDTKTPVKIAIVAVVINLVLNLILMQYYAHVGLAMATSIAGWVGAMLLAIALHKKGRFVLSQRLKTFLLKAVFSSAVMMLVLYILQPLMQPYIDESGLLYRILGISVLIAAGAGSYFVGIFATKAIIISDVKRLISYS